MIEEALLCMALNIYHEARNESTIGKMAVAQVVMNRVEDDRFPDTICGVIYEGAHSSSGHPIKNLCQFSWYCDGYPDQPRNEEAFQESYEIGKFVAEGWMIGTFDGATHYHADYVSPKWAKSHTKIVRIDRHIFYRWD
jgi:N-acetylmuramoyl-L-alanine amidase|tara:strand:- start:4316 stop:4729 length:414 start_codon:yes stop_codon:yes gene_type:complete